MTIFNAIGQVWTEIANWFIGAISNLTAVFYDSTTGLTFLGTTAVILWDMINISVGIDQMVFEQIIKLEIKEFI